MEKKEGRQERRACVRFKIPGATLNYKFMTKLPFVKNKLEDSFCPVYDLSRGGLRFFSRQEIPLAANLELEILVPGEPIPLKMKGLVRWVAPYEGKKDYAFQVGVQFFPYGEEKRQNYPGNLVKIIALEQKYIEATGQEDEDKDEFVV